jgi:serine/threonine protein kinase
MHAEGDTGAAGTPHYMAPEQVLGQSFDGRLDMYSLGCTAYELLVGKPPFVAQTVDEILQAQLERTPVPPAQLCPAGAVHPALEAVILRCLEKSPDKRFADMHDLEAALCEAQIVAGLRTLWDDLPLPAVDAERREKLARDMPALDGQARPRRRWLWPAIAGASTLVAAGVTAVLLLGRPGPPSPAPRPRSRPSPSPPAPRPPRQLGDPAEGRPERDRLPQGHRPRGPRGPDRRPRPGAGHRPARRVRDGPRQPRRHLLERTAASRSPATTTCRPSPSTRTTRPPASAPAPRPAPSPTSATAPPRAPSASPTSAPRPPCSPSPSRTRPSATRSCSPSPRPSPRTAPPARSPASTA